eukprot:scaffold270522_cov17-Prasinocladus_malaysianus.AAC.1
MVITDDQSKEYDNTAWEISDEHFAWCLGTLGVDEREIQLDPFADNRNARAPRWFSLHLCP